MLFRSYFHSGNNDPIAFHNHGIMLDPYDDFEYQEPKYDGWVYKVTEMNLKGLMVGQCAWLCPYLKFYFSEAPTQLYLKIDPLES